MAETKSPNVAEMIVAKMAIARAGRLPDNADIVAMAKSMNIDSQVLDDVIGSGVMQLVTMLLKDQEIIDKIMKLPIG